MGIYANVYWSARGQDPLSVLPQGVEQVLIVNIVGPFEPKPGDALVALECGAYGSVRAVPVDADGNKVSGVMFGGCYIASSDSRFSNKASDIVGYSFYGAVALHDRKEW